MRPGPPGDPSLLNSTVPLIPVLEPGGTHPDRFGTRYSNHPDPPMQCLLMRSLQPQGG